jgi:hypothetical protein
MLCELCWCEQADNFHHLIPRTLHSNKWFKKRFTRERMREGIRVCRQCHSAIHDLIPDEKELGRHYNTLDRLLAHPEVAGYVEWRRKKARIHPPAEPLAAED